MKQPQFGKASLVLAVFCVASALASSAQTFTPLVDFALTNGQTPDSNLIQGVDGTFYGTTGSGGTNCVPQGCGTLYKITPRGFLTTVLSFCQTLDCGDGSGPGGAFVLDKNGDFYGTTGAGGTNNAGTVYRIYVGGVVPILVSLYSFTGTTDGGSPQGLMEANDGNFYGVTFQGGSGDHGTVFKISHAGRLWTLYNFCAQGGNNCPDGSFPSAGLMQASDGNLYGTTLQGGGNKCGTVFRISTAGAFSTLHDFNRADGCGPVAVLIQGNDGNIYGTTNRGGSHGLGTIFKISLAGKFTSLYSFCSESNCADGQEPAAGLIQGTDGNFYGTTSHGGVTGKVFKTGTMYQITPAGTLTTLHNFDGTDGFQPEWLLQGTDGSFYGITSNGGSIVVCGEGCGTIYNLAMGLSPFVEVRPAIGKVGDQVTIIGNGLAGTESVSFHGESALFTVVSDTEILAVVPKGATTGSVQVTTPSGAQTSNFAFRVIP